MTKHPSTFVEHQKLSFVAAPYSICFVAKLQTVSLINTHRFRRSSDIILVSSAVESPSLTAGS
ncbi:hypothetical protein Hanom_Chr05g00444181 [Helianthus anomalus]